MKNKLSNMLKKPQIIVATSFVLSLAAISGGLAYADTATIGQHNPMSSIVNAIATNFNLNSSDVQTVINDVMESERSNRVAQEKVDQTARLNQAVTDGKITKAQADLITAKMSEMKALRDANREANQGLTQGEQRNKMQTENESLKEWAEDNNISMNFLQPGGNGHEGPGRLGDNNRPNKIGQ